MRRIKWYESKQFPVTWSEVDRGSETQLLKVTEKLNL